MKARIIRSTDKPKIIRPKKKEKVNFGTSVYPEFEKREYTGIPLESDSVRVIVLQDYKGMLEDLYVDDIIDVPERRFKSLRLRGLVEEYKGPLSPNKLR